MEILTEAPKTGSFVPLAEHQSATPASFYTGPPVLHYYSDRCKLVVLENELSSASALANLVSKAPVSTSSGAGQTNGDDSSSQGQKTVEDVDLWVTSDKLLLYSSPLSVGISIPYPTISLHAIQSLPTPTAVDTTSQGLYMQLVSETIDNDNNDDSEPDSISITIIPTASSVPVPPSAATTSHADAALETEDQPEQTPVQALFHALSTCSNLHPDPADQDDDDDEMQDGLAGSRLYQAGLVMPGAPTGSGGLPPPMPGSGGWITAENMHEYFDAEGNWIGPEEDDADDAEMGDGEEEQQIAIDSGNSNGRGGELGPGAGTVRTRDVVDENNGTNGHGDHDEDETKWRRTD